MRGERCFDIDIIFRLARFIGGGDGSVSAVPRSRRLALN